MSLARRNLCSGYSNHFQKSLHQQIPGQSHNFCIHPLQEQRSPFSGGWYQQFFWTNVNGRLPLNYFHPQLFILLTSLRDSNRNSKMEDKQTSLGCSKLQLHFQYSYSYVSASNTRTTCHGHSQQVKSTPFNQLHPHLLAAFHQLLFLFWAVLRSIPCWQKPFPVTVLHSQIGTGTKTGGVNCTLNLGLPSRVDATRLHLHGKLRS